MIDNIRGGIQILLSVIQRFLWFMSATAGLNIILTFIIVIMVLALIMGLTTAYKHDGYTDSVRVSTIKLSKSSGESQKMITGRRGRK